MQPPPTSLSPSSSSSASTSSSTPPTTTSLSSPPSSSLTSTCAPPWPPYPPCPLHDSPNVFSSPTSLRANHYRTDLDAILFARTFVSTLVIGFFVIYDVLFSIVPALFIRDALCYLMAVMFLSYVYLSVKVFLWQAIGFV